MLNQPLELEILEQLCECGEMPLSHVLLVSESAERAWHALEAMTRAGTVAWLSRRATGEERLLGAWEIATLLRNRLQGTGESCIADDDLLLKSTPLSYKAYGREC